VDWIGLAQDRYSWRALVNAEMKFYRVAAQLVASRVVLSSTELVSSFTLIIVNRKYLCISTFVHLNRTRACVHLL
jgi:hypothetical protein